MQRFLDIVIALIRIVANEAHPVVFFLDDLQWSDEASQLFVSSLACDIRSKNLLLLGAVREGTGASGDTDGGGNVDRRTYVLRVEDPRSQLFTSRVELGPLYPTAVNEIVSKLTGLPMAQTQALSTSVFNKTGGNPFYAVQYMEMLAREYLLTFDFDAKKWEWDDDAVASRTTMSENFQEIITDKIVVLSNDVQDVLMVASCLGYQFDIDILESIIVSQGLFNSGSSPSGTGGDGSSDDSNDGNDDTRFQKALQNAMKENLIVHRTPLQARSPKHADSSLNEDHLYYFTHDRIQQAAYELIMLPNGKSDPLQLKVGQLVLMMSRALPPKESMLFNGVNLVTRHSMTRHDDVDDNDFKSRLELIKMNLEACYKARNKSAYVMAAHYADRAIHLLPGNLERRWKHKSYYPLTLESYNLSAEMHFCHGHLNQCEVAAREVLQMGNNLEDKLRAYDIFLGLYQARKDYVGALREGSALLQLLGSPLPKKTGVSNVLYNFVTTKRLIQRKKTKDLLNLPPLRDVNVLNIMRILNFITLFAWSANKSDTLVLSILKMIKITIQDGVCEYSPFAFASYSSMLGGMGDHAAAFEYGAVALELVERPGMRAGYARTVEVVHFAVTHLKNPIRDSLSPVLRAFHVGMEMGDVDFAAMCLCCHTCLSIHCGPSLHSLEKELVGYAEFFRRYRQDAVRVMVLPWLQLMLNLMGKSNNPLVLTGSAMNEDDFEHEVRSSNYVAAAAHASYAKLMLYYVFGDLELAEAERKSQVDYSDVDKLSFMRCFNILFCGLTCLGIAKKDKSKRKVYQRKAKQYIKDLEAYGKIGSANCTPMLTLLEAEFATMLGAKGNYLDSYDAAISTASRSGFRLTKGIACERAAEYALSSGDLDSTGDYLDKAWSTFRQFGAEGKLRQMEQRYHNIQFHKEGQGSFITDNAHRG